MTYVLGLTGPSGAGKSTFSDTARELGIKVIDCDLVARDAVKSGSDGLCALVREYGKTILNADGTLNRRALAQIAFSSTAQTERLNKILLPYIVKLIMPQITGKVVILDAPTLFESGLQSVCNKTVAVLADRKSRLKRITERDKISESDAILRIKAGKDDKFYIDRADVILYNNGTFNQFKQTVKPELTKILKGMI